MKKNIIQVILEVILIIISLFNLFLSEKISLWLYAILIFVFLIILLINNRWKKIPFRLQKKSIIITTLMCLLFMILFYLFGIKTTLSDNYSAIYKGYLDSITWISVIACTVMTEMIRYICISKVNSNKKINLLNCIFLFVLFVLIDINISLRGTDYSSLIQIYIFFSLVVAQSIAKNLLLNYMCKKTGYASCFIYRIIIDLYIFVLPFVPDINIYVESIMFIVFPYLLYLLLSSFYQEKSIREVRDALKLSHKISSLIIIFIFLSLTLLVSQEFTYSMIAIGSESMKGTINKGDAIIYKAYKEEDELTDGDIVVFERNGTLIIHRIVKIYPLDDGIALKTKGDANETEDNWIIEEKDIVGKVKMRIPWVGLPSILICELF